MKITNTKSLPQKHILDIELGEVCTVPRWKNHVLMRIWDVAESNHRFVALNGVNPGGDTYTLTERRREETKNKRDYQATIYPDAVIDLKEP